ncbi:glycosyltransferase family 4 protein [Couchioplanes azureus]|uniref:glycosyltransferase family 4 protein n=1 Tax=Couchioplanes caeruleus TaxID=56438 RepID=UPI001671048B|nr:glycosyltransferase family 4 protein [Couchioplanes caeruleus]
MSGREVVVAALARAQNALPLTRATVVAAGPAASGPPLGGAEGGAVTVVPGRGLRAWLRALLVLWRAGPDPAATHVLHTHGSSALLLACVLRLPPGARWRCAALVHTNHGFVETLVARRMLGPAELFLHRFADRVVACSPRQVARLARGAGRPVDVVVNGIEVPPPVTARRRALARARLGLGDRFPVVGIVGRLAPEKRHDVFLTAGEGIIRHFPDAVLVIAGDGPRRDEIRRIVRERRLGDRVVLLGHVADTAGVYAALDLLLHTSDTEGTPLAVIEAMAAGVPVVATAVGGVPALLGHGRHGALAPRRRPHLLAAAAVRVLADPALRQSLARSARAHAAGELSAERMCTRLGEVYAAATGG